MKRPTNYSRDMCDQSLKLSENARTVDVGWVGMSKHNFLVSRPKVTKIFLTQRGRNSSW